jgi:hypothetical protein
MTAPALPPDVVTSLRRLVKHLDPDRLARLAEALRTAADAAEQGRPADVVAIVRRALEAESGGGSAGAGG